MMIKYICKKDCIVHSYPGSCTIKIGDIIDVFKNIEFNINTEPKSAVILINKTLYLFDYQEFFKHFIELAEWRDKQINDILDEND